MTHGDPDMSGEQVPERLAYPFPEAARLLGVSLSTVKRLVGSGRLRTADVGGKRRIPRASLYALLETPDADQEVAQ